MSFYLSALAVVILILFGLLLMRKVRTQTSRQPQPKTDVPLTPQAQLYKLQKNERFWGVSVESHCSASSGLAGKQFPIDAAPVIPVRGCEAPTCKCSYFGLPERRQQGERRSGQDRRRSLRIESEERRAERPRRKVDLISWQSYRHL